MLSGLPTICLQQVAGMCFLNDMDVFQDRPQAMVVQR